MNKALKHKRPVLIPRNYANRIDMRRMANGETKIIKDEVKKHD